MIRNHLYHRNLFFLNYNKTNFPLYCIILRIVKFFKRKNGYTHSFLIEKQGCYLVANILIKGGEGNFKLLSYH